MVCISKLKILGTVSRSFIAVHRLEEDGRNYLEEEHVKQATSRRRSVQRQHRVVMLCNYVYYIQKWFDLNLIFPRCQCQGELCINVPRSLTIPTGRCSTLSSLPVSCLRETNGSTSQSVASTATTYFHTFAINFMSAIPVPRIHPGPVARTVTGSFCERR